MPINGSSSLLEGLANTTAICFGNDDDECPDFHTECFSRVDSLCKVSDILSQVQLAVASLTK